MNRILIALTAFVVWSGLAFGAGWLWRGDRAERDVSTQVSTTATGQAQAQATARTQEQHQAVASQAAGDSADQREEKINEDYDARLAAALAGRDADLGRMRQQWEASTATARLSSDAGIAAAAAEADRLRRAGAARILRATQLAQSERDEVIGRYEAFRNAGVTQ